ncbi:MAG: hypothetical protein ACOX6B_05160 [Thermoguttaceae bacterium]
MPTGTPETTDDRRKALKLLPGGTTKTMTEAEMTEHPGYRKSARPGPDHANHGTLSTDVCGKYGRSAPMLRKGIFESQVIRNRRKDISAIDDATDLPKSRISDQSRNI